MLRLANTPELIFQIKVRHGHGRRGWGDRSDTSKGMCNCAFTLNYLYSFSWSRRPLLFLTLITMVRSAWRSWVRSWVDTIFTPQGALDTFLFQKQTKNVILLIKLTPHLPHKVPSHSFNSDTQNVNTKDILGGHHIHPSSCPCYLSLAVMIIFPKKIYTCLRTQWIIPIFLHLEQILQHKTFSL